jgi:hypothetical protein
MADIVVLIAISIYTVIKAIIKLIAELKGD